ncbi:MAG TPA: SRPBCC family protein [Streptosporangiaceae bacterium]|nr:SRPBCC family protein [Streptosporangiaceae bacterium]
MRPLAEIAIEYTGFQRPSRLTSTMRMAQAEFSEMITFEPAGAGTRLRWSWDVWFTWPLRLLAPVLARVGGRQEQATLASLKRYLESSPHAAGPGAGEQPGPASGDISIPGVPYWPVRSCPDASWPKGRATPLKLFSI